ncbi:MAG: sialidase family protein [Candidatus Eisenbacteria bacterium]
MNLIPLLIAGLMGCGKSGTVTGPPAAPAQWSRVSSGLPGTGYCSALTASGTTLLAGTPGFGVFRSTDGGLTWTAVTTQPTNLDIVSLAASGTTLLAGTDAGVSRSTDGGLTWTAAMTQPTSLIVTSLTANGTALFAGTSTSGIWRYLL